MKHTFYANKTTGAAMICEYNQNNDLPAMLAAPLSYPRVVFHTGFSYMQVLRTVTAASATFSSVAAMGADNAYHLRVFNEAVSVPVSGGGNYKPYVLIRHGGGALTTGALYTYSTTGASRAITAHYDALAQNVFIESVAVAGNSAVPAVTLSNVEVFLLG